MMRRRLTYMGDYPGEATLKSQAQSLITRLQDANNQLMDLQNMLAQMTPGSADAISLGQKVMQLRNDYESMVTKFTWAYAALFGSAPPGLSALGIDPATAVIVAAAITALFAALAIWLQNAAAARAQGQAALQRAQAQGTTSNAIAATSQQLSDAIANGDQARIAALQAQLNVLQAQGQNISDQSSAGQPSSSFTDWIKQNWFLVGGGVAGLLLLRDV